jgi:hypothetical protein
MGIVWLLSIAVAIGVVVLAVYDTYEIKEKWRDADAKLKRWFVTQCVFVWFLAVASTLLAVFTNLDTAAKDKEIRDLKAELTPPNISQKDHDAFVSYLKDKPKGEVPVYVLSPSVPVVNYAQQIRSLLDDAGYSCKVNGIELRPDISIYSPEQTSVFLMCFSTEDSKTIDYAAPLQQGFYQISINASGLTQNNTVVAKGHIAICVVNQH